MPRGSPFTALCRQFAGLDGPRGADLHVHTISSDGSFTPSQVVAFARQAKLRAVAITDHDTLAGIAEARRTAAEMPSPTVEVVPGVEITTSHHGRELHLLGYFVREDHAGLNALLNRSCDIRRERFRHFVSALETQGTTLPREPVEQLERTSSSLGRRHLASLIVRTGLARTHHEAWQRFVGPLSKNRPTTAWPTIEEAIDVVRAARGVPSLAHPPSDYEEANLRTLRDAGLLALEAIYPWNRSSAGSRLRGIVKSLDLLITGGSDSHGPEPANRTIGAHRIDMDDLQRIRERALQSSHVA